MSMSKYASKADYEKAQRDATHGECLPTPYKVDTHPIPLDTLAVFGKEECWYRIPSRRVHFDHDALRNADIRLHRAIGSHGVWTLTEATTGLKLHADMPHEFYIGDEGAMLAEFAAGRMLQLTPEKMQDAIAKGKEKVAQHSRCPFAPSETVARCPNCNRTTPYGITPGEECAWPTCPMKAASPSARAAPRWTPDLNHGPDHYPYAEREAFKDGYYEAMQDYRRFLGEIK